MTAFSICSTTTLSARMLCMANGRPPVNRTPGTELKLRA
uniref:Uncharacterized protein n=1 Tax=Anguilla anguilla TaxID=7936 RepID=A0A0E9QY74_ANGAN